MRARLLMAAASILFFSSVPAAVADWDEDHDHMRHLRWDCEQGSRHACFRLGQEVQQHREAWRERREWREREAWRDRERWERQPQVWVWPQWGWGRGRGW